MSCIAFSSFWICFPKPLRTPPTSPSVRCFFHQSIHSSFLLCFVCMSPSLSNEDFIVEEVAVLCFSAPLHSLIYFLSDKKRRQCKVSFQNGTRRRKKSQGSLPLSELTLSGTRVFFTLLGEKNYGVWIQESVWLCLKTCPENGFLWFACDC